MAETASRMMDLGTVAPDFHLKNAVDGKEYGLDDFRGAKALLVMFICNHCPYVVRVREEFKRLEDDYSSQGVKIVAINSNSLRTHPQDGPEHMKPLAREMGWDFPFLFDETQEVAKAYQAACTPDFFLFDQELKLAYRGQLDDARPSNSVSVTGKDLRAAMDAVLAGQAPSPQQRPSLGCNIKWHPAA